MVYPDRKVCPVHSAVLHCTVLQVKYCLTVRQPPDSLNLPSQVLCAVQLYLTVVCPAVPGPVERHAGPVQQRGEQQRQGAPPDDQTQHGSVRYTITAPTRLQCINCFLDPVGCSHCKPGLASPKSNLATAPAPERWKLALALIYGLFVSWLTAVTMTVVHDRVPDMNKEPQSLSQLRATPLDQVKSNLNGPNIPGANVVYHIQ